jgi:hypothetical protein
MVFNQEHTNDVYTKGSYTSPETKVNTRSIAEVDKVHAQVKTIMSFPTIIFPILNTSKVKHTLTYNFEAIYL